MKEMLLKFKNHSLTFYALNIYMIIILLLPKQYSTLFSIPIRLVITFILFIIIFIDYKSGKVEFNKKRNLKLIFFFLLFIFSTIPSLFVTLNLVTSIYTVFKFLFGFILFYLLTRISFKKEEYGLFIKTFIILALIMLVIGVIFYKFNINLLVNNSGIGYYPGAKGRLNITLFNTIYYGIYLDLITPLMLYLLYKTDDKKKIAFYLIVIGLIYINLIFTFTRSALIAFFTILLLVAILFNKRILKFRTLIMVLMITVASFFIPGGKPLINKTFNDVYLIASNFTEFVGINITERTETVAEVGNIEDGKPKYVDYDVDSEFVDYSLQHREAFARISTEIANDNLLTGVGFGAYIDYMNSETFDIKYPEYTLTKTHPHSALLLIFAETGIFGVSSFVIIIIFLVFKSINGIIRNIKRNENAYLISSIAFSTACGFIIINAMSENAIYDTQIGYIFYLIYGLLISFLYKIDNKRVLFISSTGGHLNELTQLKPLIDKYDSYIITEKTKSNEKLKNKYKHVNYLVYGTKDHLFTYIFKFTYNCIKSILLYIRINPTVIVTTGAHTAVPMCYIGKLFGAKIIFIESFANSKTKTLSGSLVYPIADDFIVQWDTMKENYPKAEVGGWIY